MDKVQVIELGVAMTELRYLIERSIVVTNKVKNLIIHQIN